MLKYFFIFLAFLQPMIFAVEFSSFKINNLCHNSLEKYLNDNHLKNESFREILADSYKERAYRTSTYEIANTHEFHFSESHLKKIIQIKNGKMNVAEINPKNCEINFKSSDFPWYVSKVFNQKRELEFTDQDLLQTILEKKKGLIYFWSPQFSYSVEYIPTIYQISKKLKLELILVADPRVSNEEINQAINKTFNLKTNSLVRSIASNEKIKIMKSYDLFLRNGFNHFPVMYYFSNKKIHPQWITGIMTLGGIRELTNKYEKDLK